MTSPLPPPPLKKTKSGEHPAVVATQEEMEAMRREVEMRAAERKRRRDAALAAYIQGIEFHSSPPPAAPRDSKP